MQVKLELVGVREALKMFDPKIVTNAARMAVNRVSASGRTEASKIIRQEYNVAAARIAQFLSLTTRAKGNEVEAVITGRGRGMALAYFDARQVLASKITRSSKATGRQITGVLVKGDVTVKVRKGGGRKVVSSKYGNRPFIATMKSGHRGVWVRTGAKRKPIEQLLGPGVGGLFGSRRIMTAVQKRINEQFAPEFKHQLEYYQGRAR